MTFPSRTPGLVVVTAMLACASATHAGIVADYTFDVFNDTVAVDSSGNGNDGTIVGFAGLPLGAGDAPGSPGYTSDGRIRLVANGPIEYIDSGIAVGAFLTNSFTIETVTGLSDGGFFWQPLIAYTQNNAFFYWGAGYNQGTDRPPHWHIDNGGPWVSYSDYETVLPDGAMHHYAITYDANAGRMYMYLDYEKIGDVPADLSSVVAPGDVGTLLVGSHNGLSAGEVWHGVIDRVRFADHAVDPNDFIPVPGPGTLSLLALAGLANRRRR
jgi:hypothetical protein